MDDVTMSNIERSRIARDDQGTYETEVSIGGREDLSIIKDQCAKNPGHEEFISINNLSIQHLPQEYQDAEVLECTKLQALLTVCLFVNYTSPDRPATFPGSDTPYPFFNLRDQYGMRVGTGSIEVIHENNQNTSNCKCYCTECTASGDPKTEWGKIIIQTVKHVVFDQKECQHTEIECFYDNEERGEVYKLNGRVMDEQMDSDWCLIYCATHNMKLVNRLQDIQHRYAELKKQLLEQYSGVNPKLVAIASHPHGCCKHITFGTWTDREVLGLNRIRYVYTAATCPGCSGARVWILAEHDECKWMCFMHSQTVSAGKGMSGVGWY